MYVTPWVPARKTYRPISIWLIRTKRPPSTYRTISAALCTTSATLSRCVPPSWIPCDPGYPGTERLANGTLSAGTMRCSLTSCTVACQHRGNHYRSHLAGYRPGRRGEGIDSDIGASCGVIDVPCARCEEKWSFKSIINLFKHYQVSRFRRPNPSFLLPS